MLAALGDGVPRSTREVSGVSGLSLKEAGNALFLCWLRGLVLQTAKPVYEHERLNRGRGGCLIRGRTIFMSTRLKAWGLWRWVGGLSSRMLRSTSMPGAVGALASRGGFWRF